MITDELIARVDWEPVRGARIFVTGGSGFFGRWVLGLWAHSNRVLALNSQAVVLTRDAERFRQRLPELASDPALALHVGDATNFELPTQRFDFALHLAGEPLGPGYRFEPRLKMNSILEGVGRVLDLNPDRLLFISSGAVYGRQHVDNIEEDTPFADEPDMLRRSYGVAKQVSEENVIASAVPTVIARPFAFMGPGLPLDAAFAASQFFAAGLAGKPVRVEHGRVVRSYLDAADLAVWLWTILLRGEAGRAYNVGSETPVTLAELGLAIAGEFGVPCDVKYGGVTQRYVPSTERARDELALRETITWQQSVARTAAWHRAVA